MGNSVETSSIFHIDYPAKEVFPSPADDTAAAFDRLMVEKAREEWNKGTYEASLPCFEFWKNVLALVCPKGTPPTVAVGDTQSDPIKRYNIWRVILDFPPPFFKHTEEDEKPGPRPAIQVKAWYERDGYRYSGYLPTECIEHIKHGNPDNYDKDLYNKYIRHRILMPNRMMARGVAYNFIDRSIIDIASQSEIPNQTLWIDAANTISTKIGTLPGPPGSDTFSRWKEFINPGNKNIEYDLNPVDIDENASALVGLNKYEIWTKFLQYYTDERINAWKTSDARPTQLCVQVLFPPRFPIRLSPSVGCEEFEIVKKIDWSIQDKMSWDDITKILKKWCEDGMNGILSDPFYLKFIGKGNSSFTRTSDMDIISVCIDPKEGGKAYSTYAFKRDEKHFKTVVKAFMDKWTAAVKDSPTGGANREGLRKQEVAQIIDYYISNKKETDNKYTLVKIILNFIKKSRTLGAQEKDIDKEVAKRLAKERYRCTRCGGGRRSRRSLK